ncbi:MAG: hypothetical protein NZ805_14220 [Armatimonadetes bacterium]|nr:hypothetical protein [Armatimonadota bacterium]MDW8029953.1 hypothetical protein [Armatimonadota bacterium]
MFEPVREFWLNLSLIFGAIFVSIVILAAVHASPPQFKRILTVIVVFIAGLYFPVEFYIPRHNFLTPYGDSVRNLVQVLAAFTFGLGVVNLVLIHGRHVLQRTTNFPFSLAFFAGFLIMTFVGFIQRYSPQFWVKKAEAGQISFWDGMHKLLFEGMLIPLTSTVFSLLAFFIVSAAYRAFRIRTLEAGLLMATAIIVMLANVPVGTWLTSWIPAEGWLKWFRLENAAIWLTTQINAPTQRAILFGLWVGAIGAALRIWLSLERTFTAGSR